MYKKYLFKYLLYHFIVIIVSIYISYGKKIDNFIQNWNHIGIYEVNVQGSNDHNIIQKELNIDTAINRQNITSKDIKNNTETSYNHIITDDIICECQITNEICWPKARCISLASSITILSLFSVILVAWVLQILVAYIASKEYTRIKEQILNEKKTKKLAKDKR
ncbi:uncharacterized protein CMU_038250 [Cryptosporidium muris RN66]|uniref:Uncharacterized protein n=1 Tax=Cryptosporidium muris (strain RN66) TaxID=441375 RepID=B6A968_CRYMR|nr:uncharacterized protein CMU_038250 [Cryptosporidium muris RN66]EEA04759.1 hypothetical protein CMU_038250 [Cryptosporidium muris RN66]|eukprot:XP_002139108.1 hypothetical protein [Cryptosporidium muris RN66]